MDLVVLLRTQSTILSASAQQSNIVMISLLNTGRHERAQCICSSICHRTKAVWFSMLWMLARNCEGLGRIDVRSEDKGLVDFVLSFNSDGVFEEKE